MLERYFSFVAAAALTLLVCGGCTQRPPEATGAIRIMPLGDSITQGARGRDSWRRALWLTLKRAGYPADFVGSQTSNHWGAGANSDFDTEHEGHWGWRADQVLEKIDGWFAAQPAQIVLLHIGTNDIGGGQSVESTVAEVAQIIAEIRRHNASVTVLLAQIIPVNGKGANRRIAQYNAELAAMAVLQDNSTSPVILVDQFSGFDAAADTYDGIHPNESGNAKMAAKWFDALREVLPPPSDQVSATSAKPMWVSHWLIEPQAAVISTNRAEHLRNSVEGETTAIPGAPDLAVEVLSPGNTGAKIHAWVADYVSAGTAVVRVADTDSQTDRRFRELLAPRTLA